MNICGLLTPIKKSREWIDECWMGVKTVLRIAYSDYSNQKITICRIGNIHEWPRHPHYLTTSPPALHAKLTVSQKRRNSRTFPKTEIQVIAKHKNHLSLNSIFQIVCLIQWMFEIRKAPKSRHNLTCRLCENCPKSRRKIVSRNLESASRGCFVILKALEIILPKMS